jgi:beta-lactamase regulating signal transducer with metallopeptidase domain
MNLISGMAQRTVVKSVPIENPVLTFTNTIQGAQSYQPVTYKTNVLEGFFDIASVIWIIIAIAAILAMIILYVLTMSELRKATKIKDNLYEGTMVSTPTVCGIYKARIILPLGVKSEDLEYILLHERVHVRRWDNLWRMVAIVTACIHWFNPFSWLFLKIFLEDCELACDEAAVKELKPEERKGYARTLLNYAVADKTVFSSAFGSNKVKLRIQQVLTYRQITRFSALCFGVMVLVVAFLLLTNGAVK